MMRSILLRMSRSSWLQRQAKRRKFARKAVRKFMPGESIDDALGAAGRLGRRGIGVVLTELGENVTSEEKAASVCRHYQRVLDRVAALAVDAEISVKPTHLGLDVGPEVALQNLVTLARKAAALDTTVWVDMEDSSYVDATLDLVRSVRGIGPHVGVCLQAYLHRTPDDLATLKDPAIRVRLVKGAYRETPAIALQKRAAIDQRFQDLAVSVIRDRDYIARATPVFGTHDEHMIERVREAARQYGVAPGQLEFHLLYGIRQDLQEWLAAVGSRVRVLISYGEHWYPWYMRRLAERPGNLWFVARKFFG